MKRFRRISGKVRNVFNRRFRIRIFVFKRKGSDSKKGRLSKILKGIFKKDRSEGKRRSLALLFRRKKSSSNTTQPVTLCNTCSFSGESSDVPEAASVNDSSSLSEDDSCRSLFSFGTDEELSWPSDEEQEEESEDEDEDDDDFFLIGRSTYDPELEEVAKIIEDNWALEESQRMEQIQVYYEDLSQPMELVLPQFDEKKDEVSSLQVVAIFLFTALLSVCSTAVPQLSDLNDLMLQNIRESTMSDEEKSEDRSLTSEKSEDTNFTWDIAFSIET